MRIEINASAVIAAAVVGICAWAVYKQAKTESKKQAAFKELKEKTLKERNFDEEIDKATIANDKLTVDSRSKAKQVLKEDFHEVEKATTEETFTNAVEELDRDIQRFTVGKDAETEANVLYQYNILQMKLEKKKACEERAIRNNEINKIVDMMGRPISTANLTLNDDSIRLISKTLMKAIEKRSK